ncbi:MAG: class I SAM-dependent methyltransferase [Rhodospirillales bacterium]
MNARPPQVSGRLAAPAATSPPSTARAAPEDELCSPTSICPLCKSGSRPVFTIDGYPILDCTVCKHRFVSVVVPSRHVQEIYGDDYFIGGGAGYDNYLSEGEILTQHGRQYAEILARHGAPGALLDVGAAAGFILRGLIEAGWQGQGLEPNRTMAACGLSDVGVEIHCGTIEDVSEEDLGGNVSDHHSYDLITMIQVVAHFYDLDRAFRRASSLTRPGGLWLIETWNRNSVTARVLGRWWHEYSPPSVVRWFDPDELASVVARYGLREIDRGRPIKMIRASHAKAILLHKLPFRVVQRVSAAAMRTIPDHLILPYPAEDLFWALYRKEA